MDFFLRALVTTSAAALLVGMAEAPVFDRNKLCPLEKAELALVLKGFSYFTEDLHRIKLDKEISKAKLNALKNIPQGLNKFPPCYSKAQKNHGRDGEYYIFKRAKIEILEKNVNSKYVSVLVKVILKNIYLK